LELEVLKEEARRKGSRLILAVDNPSHLSLIEKLKSLLAGVKLGAIPIISGKAENVIKKERDLYFISDMKIADIPEISLRIAEKLVEMGFRGVIFHLFPMSLEESVKLLHERGCDAIGVAMMSHKNAFIFEENFEKLIKYGITVDVDGFVVGATRPEYISRARGMTRKPILSPGIVKQGAMPGEAIRYGADFEIVGRAITESPDPVSAAEEIVKKEREVIC